MTFNDFLSTLQDNNISEIICLVTQLLITMHTYQNLRKNKQQFPVKQLSPLLSTVALISFFLLNCISFTARALQQQNYYYNPQYKRTDSSCGQCRLYDHPQMIILAILYNGLRELPLIIFIIKTYRVCLCYKKKIDQQLSNRVISLFSNQKKMLILSVIISSVFMIAVWLVFGSGTAHNGNLIFEFFCPKQSSIYDWIIIILRFIAMSYIYIISIYTYNQLDFKFFLILVFILTNTQVILRMFLALAEITKTTYHQFYYHSFVMNLFGTLIMFYYSTLKQQRSSPLSLPILQNFKAFLQTRLGFSVLMLFAQHLNKQHKTTKYVQAFQAYIEIDLVLKLAYQNQFQIKQVHIPTILAILNNSRLLQDLQDRQKLIQKCKRRQLNHSQLRAVQKKLSDFCQTYIFYQWRQTQSSKYLQTEFKNNGVINLRMTTLGIEL